MSDRTRTIRCPCGAEAWRMDTRKTVLPRIIRVRLYNCKNGHQIETAETIVGEPVPVRRAKEIINKYTVKAGRAKRRANDFDL